MSLLLWAHAAFGQAPAVAIPEISQTFASTFLVGGADTSAGRFVIWTNAGAASIDRRLLAPGWGGDPRLAFCYGQLDATRTALLNIGVQSSRGTGQGLVDLSDRFEAMGSVRFDLPGAGPIIMPMAGGALVDDSSPYQLAPPNAAELAAWIRTAIGLDPRPANMEIVLADFLQPAVTFYRADRTIDRSFSGFPAWGGGNVTDPFNFVHDGANFRLYQVIPFIGGAIGGRNGDMSIHIRNRDKSRGNNTLEEMPTRIRLATADWTGLPWVFTRTTEAAEFTNAGSGGNARKNVIYKRDIDNRSSLTPALVGIADPAQSGVDGESFTIELFFD